MLTNGEAFPTLDIAQVGGGTISLPGDLDGAWGVVLIYRGAWCPVCNAQLAAFAKASDQFAELGIEVVAFSVDDEATTAELVEEHGLTFSAGHSADADEVAARHRRLHQRRTPLPPAHRLHPGPRLHGGGRRLLLRIGRPPAR